MDNFNRYLTYEEYKELGGELPEDAFNYLERKAQRFLDGYTFDRIQYLVKNQLPIPEVVKEVLFEFIRQLDTYDKQHSNDGTVTTYSNGVENITYRIPYEADMRRSMRKLAVQWLPIWLVCREVRFDVKKYLQSINYPTE